MICFLTSNGVVLCYDDIPCRYFEIVNEFPYLDITLQIEQLDMAYHLRSELAVGATNMDRQRKV